MMGGNEYNDDGAVEVSLNGRQTDCRDDIKEGQWRVMGVILGGHGTVDHGDLSYKGVHEEEAGKNHGVCSRETDI